MPSRKENAGSDDEHPEGGDQGLEVGSGAVPAIATNNVSSDMGERVVL
jgi:hypothetical protein